MPEATAETKAEGAPAAEVKTPATGADKTAAETTTQGKQEQTKTEKVEFFAKRKEAEAKKLSEENALLKQQLEESRRVPEPAPVETEELSPLDDPQKWAKQTEERIEKKLLAGFQAREQESRLVGAAESAEKWLLSQSHVQEDPKFTSELEQTIKSKYWAVAGVDPMSAARLAYEDVCKAKGISSGSEDGQSTIGVKPSGSSGGGKRIFARGEGKKYISEVSPDKDLAEYRRRTKEVAEAEKEGRIR